MHVLMDMSGYEGRNRTDVWTLGGRCGANACRHADSDLQHDVADVG